MNDPKITAALVDEHGLSSDEFHRIKKILGRDPSFTELGIFSVMWSEHCSYKSSRVHFSRFPTDGPGVLQGPGENAGIVDIGDGWGVCFKMESHNHPSFIEPYQGAATGVGGILRDVFTMGARPIACLDALWFGDTKDSRTPHLTHGVVAGIAGYGNAFGVPTVAGSTTFHKAYNQNILVNAMAVGLVPTDRIFRAAAGGVGNPILYVGAKTGRDGIHGATMASEQFDEESESKRPTVQVGDPFTEKLLVEALMELFATDLVVGIQDMGAAGLTSSSVEMAGRAGTGVELNLDQIPMREDGMTPYELMLSESQERMLMVTRPGCEDDVRAIFEKWDLECVVVGKVTDTGRLVVSMHGDVFANIPVDPISEEAPKLRRPSQKPPVPAPLKLVGITQPEDLGGTLCTLLASPNIANKAWVYEQYDYMVRTNTVVPPGGDAALVRVKGTSKAIAMTADCNIRYCGLDPLVGAEGAVAEAARNIAAVGGAPLAITDCLNFGNPETPAVMGQFEAAVEGISRGCEALGIAVVSGNVSFYNETDGVAIPPTPSIGMVGLVGDVSQHVGIAFRSNGDHVYLVGNDEPTLGGSEYLAVLHGLEAGVPPQVDWEKERAVCELVRQGIQGGQIHSAHDLSSGGLAVALAECILAGGKNPCGVEVAIPVGERADVELFGESHGRFLVSVSPEEAAIFEELAADRGVTALDLGRVGGDQLVILDLLALPVARLYQAWQSFPPWELPAESVA